MSVESRFIEVAGQRTHYLEAGTGPHVVLLHGGEFGANADLAWRRNITAIADAGFHVLAPDLLGFGKSAKVFDFEDPQGHRMHHVAKMLKELGVGPAHFVANSAGGHLLLKVMIGIIPAAFDVLSITVISPAPPAMEGLGVLMSYDGSPEHMRRILQVLFHDEIWANDERVAERQESALIPGAFESTTAMTLGPPGGGPGLVRDDVDYGIINVPTLVVAGAEDELLFEGLPEQLAEQAPLGRLEVFEKAKHCAHIEHSERFNALLVDFLTSQMS
jgi:pimeloyl-ACP methyl ester carboxylesterase